MDSQIEIWVLGISLVYCLIVSIWLYITKQNKLFHILCIAGLSFGLLFWLGYVNYDTLSFSLLIIQLGKITSISIFLSVLLFIINKDMPKFVRFPYMIIFTPVMIIPFFLMIYDYYYLGNWMIHFYTISGIIVLIVLYIRTIKSYPLNIIPLFASIIFVVFTIAEWLLAISHIAINYTIFYSFILLLISSFSLMISSKGYKI